MNIIDRLQGRSGGRIQVFVEPLQAGPGTEMAVRLRVLDGLDDKARAVLAGVTCTGRYQVEERDRDSTDNVVTREVWREVEVYEGVEEVYWYNPEGQWDWWMIGGRWRGEHVRNGGYIEDIERERCDLCNGTGTRSDKLGIEAGMVERKVQVRLYHAGTLAFD